MKIGFDNELYLKMQSEHIRERIESFGGKLYLEFGGKLFDDYHAARVLPGFAPDSKMRMLQQLSDQSEIVIVISADDIEKAKMRGDLGITYDMEVLRLIGAFREKGLYVGSVVITRFDNQPLALSFEHKVRDLDIPVFHHYHIEGYPSDIIKIVSEEGYGKNDYIETTRSLVVVTGRRPGSGKMATCLSQLYHEHKRGITAGYAKFETFPIWNLPLSHPVNIAYEAATADLDDVNMIDPFHLEAYGQTCVNYNRDIEIFPVLNAMFKRIYGTSPYQSPTDMGVNMVGNCITDDAVVSAAGRQEILRRYYAARVMLRKEQCLPQEVQAIQLLMQKLDITDAERPVLAAARRRRDETGAPAVAIELPDGRVITGKTSNLMGCSASALMNALKELAGIPDEVLLIDSGILEPIQRLKVDHLGNHNPRLHSDEILIALSICAVSDEQARKALDQLSGLAGCEIHSTVILSQVDENVFRKLGMHLTCDPEYQAKRHYLTK